MSDAFKPLLARLADGATLSEDDAGEFFAACLRGEPTPAQVGAALTAMRMRGETMGEITACARAMRTAAIHARAALPDHRRLRHRRRRPAHAQHLHRRGLRGGRRRAEGRQARQPGAVVEVRRRRRAVRAGRRHRRRPPSGSCSALDEAGICFLFAPAHHGAMRHVSPIRAELGFRTIFNLLGPLTNPAGAKRQVVGVFAERWVAPLAQVLGALGSERAWVVHGGGLDEMTTTGETSVAECREGQVRLFTVTPEAVGLPRAALADLTGGDAGRERRGPARACCEGEPGAYRDIVLLNAAAAFLVGDKVETLREGVELAGRGHRRRPRPGRARQAGRDPPAR